MKNNHWLGSTLILTGSLCAFGGPLIQNGSFNTPGNTLSFAINVDQTLPGWAATPVNASDHPLDCLVTPGATTNLCGPTAFGGGFTFWVNPGPSPDGGNYVAIDGSNAYATPLTQTVAGLIVGNYYTLTFYQASGQQNGFSGNTTEQWQVTLGSQIRTTPIMTTLSHGSVGWSFQSLDFKADATSEVLSFLAVGTPSGVPPFVMLDGVGLNAATAPEPETWALVGLGLLAIPLIRKR